jgi:hypothetical protein
VLRFFSHQHHQTSLFGAQGAAVQLKKSSHFFVHNDRKMPLRFVCGKRSDPGSQRQGQKNFGSRGRLLQWCQNSQGMFVAFKKLQEALGARLHFVCRSLMQLWQADADGVRLQENASEAGEATRQSGEADETASGTANGGSQFCSMETDRTITGKALTHESQAKEATASPRFAS